MPTEINLTVVICTIGFGGIIVQKNLPSQVIYKRIHWPCYCTVHVSDSVWSRVKVNLCKFFICFVYICIVGDPIMTSEEGWDPINQ
jgi:hypothetical protein